MGGGDQPYPYAPKKKKKFSLHKTSTFNFYGLIEVIENSLTQWYQVISTQEDQIKEN